MRYLWRLQFESGYCVFQCWFFMRWENRSNQEKFSLCREENPRTQPTYSIESMNQNWAILVEWKGLISKETAVSRRWESKQVDNSQISTVKK